MKSTFAGPMLPITEIELIKILVRNARGLPPAGIVGCSPRQRSDTRGEAPGVVAIKAVGGADAIAAWLLPVATRALCGCDAGLAAVVAAGSQMMRSDDIVAGTKRMLPMQSAFQGSRSSRMSGAEFRAFQAQRPDHERWELLGGAAMMVTPPTIAHNQIASHLERLLNAALTRHAPSLLAAQRPGLDLGEGDYKPEPDVGIIDADYDAGQRFVEKAHLLAEVVSDTDEVIVPGTDRRWIDVKRDLYRSHPHCAAVLVIAQDRMEVALDLRTEAGWALSVLQGGDAELSIPMFGLRSLVANLYERTPLQKRARG